MFALCVAIVVVITGNIMSVFFIIIFIVNETCIVICLGIPLLCHREGKVIFFGSDIGCFPIVIVGAISGLSSVVGNGEIVSVMSRSMCRPLLH